MNSVSKLMINLLAANVLLQNFRFPTKQLPEREKSKVRKRKNRRIPANDWSTVFRCFVVLATEPNFLLNKAIYYRTHYYISHYNIFVHTNSLSTVFLINMHGRGHMGNPQGNSHFCWWSQTSDFWWLWLTHIQLIKFLKY